MYAITHNANGTTSWRAIESAAELMTGEVAADTPPPPSVADSSVLLVAAVQSWLDTTAQANGYNDMNSCVSYANSGVAQWAADAKAGIAWRDAVWQACFADQSSMTSAPTASALIASLPQPSAYGWTVHAPGA